jgi:glutamine amidotransferase-like uncharacterized protein
MRGKGDVKIELTDKGRDILGLPSGQIDIRYANGPILVPAKNDAIADFEALAFFRTELAEHDSPKSAMINSPAIVRGTLGKGRVIVSSPHPEQTPGMETFIEHAVHWLAEK